MLLYVQIVIKIMHYHSYLQIFELHSKHYLQSCYREREILSVSCASFHDCYFVLQMCHS